MIQAADLLHIEVWFFKTTILEIQENGNFIILDIFGKNLVFVSPLLQIL